MMIQLDFNSKTFFIVGTLSKIPKISTIKKQLTYCDIIEIRYDQQWHKQDITPILKELNKFKPILLTIRTNREGGEWDISDEKRKEIFLQYQNSIQAIDLEIQSDLFNKLLEKVSLHKDLKVITSYHNYKQAIDSSNILDFEKKSLHWGAHLLKIAHTPQTTEEHQNTSKVLKKTDINLCLISMGEKFSNSRIELVKHGSKLTYGYLDEPIAPGQFSCKNLHEKLC